MKLRKIEKFCVLLGFSGKIRKTQLFALQVYG
jgi:hypothetical protein